MNTKLRTCMVEASQYTFVVRYAMMGVVVTGGTK